MSADRATNWRVCYGCPHQELQPYSGDRGFLHSVISELTEVNTLGAVW